MYTVDIDIWKPEHRGKSADAPDAPVDVLGGFFRRRLTRDGVTRAYVPQSDATAVGENAGAQGPQSCAVGSLAEAVDTGTSAVGANASAKVKGATAIGESAKAARARSTVAGHHSLADGINTAHFGESGRTTASNGTTVGQGSFNDAADGTLVGQGGLITGLRTTGVGRGIVSTHNDCILLGNGTVSTANRQFVAGSSTSPIDGLVLGNGFSNAAPIALVLVRLTQATGSNVAAPQFQIGPGLGTGNAIPSEIHLLGSNYAASGSTAQIERKRLLINGSRADLTSGAAYQVMSLTLPANSMMGGSIFYTIECSDGADFQAASGVVTFTAVDDSGVATGGTTQDHERSTVTAGTLASTWAYSSRTIRVTPTSTGLGTITTFRINFSAFNHGGGDIAASHV